MAPDRHIRNLFARQAMIDMAVRQYQNVNALLLQRGKMAGAHTGIDQHPQISAL
jgi:hypothetical protein